MKKKRKKGLLIGRRGQLIESRKNFTIRLSDEEREQAEYDAKANNMKLSDYVRYLITHGGRVDTTLAYDRRNLISQISGLCNNYNQMTRTANGCGYVFDSTMRTGNHLLEQIKGFIAGGGEQVAITKMMHMKASSKARIDIHLEHSINYILQPKKLGEANLAGGINCLPEMAYRQMKATKQMFGKTGGRQGYHFVISLKPGEGTPEIMYDIAMRFAEEAYAGEYEAVVAVHTDREHLHAHIIINSVNMVTGYKFQCRDGDWKYKFQPITNKLCEEYGLHITTAEYSKEPKNMARPQWEREQAFSKWIKQDALFCAISAENMEHFIFLLEKLGFEVKQGKHIAVKVPGMKRFKRLDTISEDLSRESLEAMFRYGDASLASPVNRTTALLPARKLVLKPYQGKCYARMYRLRLAEKKRFTYKSAYLYEQIRKMHELQEEYLVVVKYDVKSYGDLFRLKLRLQRVDEELCKVQKEMYRDRALQKRYCKTAQDLELYEASEDDYRERLEQIKLQKKDNRKKLKAVERCLERDGSLLEAELEMRIPVDDMEDLAEVKFETNK